jgi:3-hydroxyacyl-CoA dehydrogenase
MNASQAKNIAVIGAGLMGHGIALSFALGGFSVRLHDLTVEQVQRGLDRIRTILAQFEESELVSASEAERALEHIHGTTGLAEAGMTSRSPVWGCVVRARGNLGFA